MLSDVAAAQAVSLPAPAGDGRLAPPGDPAPSTRLALSAQLANLPPFAALEPDRLHALVVQARAVDLPAGGILFHQGDASKSLYVVVDGAVVPIAEGGAGGAEGRVRRKLAVLERGDLVGEIGLVTRQPRNATVVALVDSKLLAIDRAALLPVMRESRELAEHILAPVRRRMLDRQLRTNLFFAAFAPPAREAVARRFRVLEVKAGTKLVRQGEPPEGLFVVLSGSLSRIDARSGREQGGLGIGDVFGGRSLLAGVPSASDVVANGRAWLLVLGESRFRRLIETHPRVARVVKRLSEGEAGELESQRKGAQATSARASSRRPSHPPSRPPRTAPRARAGAAGRAPRSRS